MSAGYSSRDPRVRKTGKTIGAFVGSATASIASHTDISQIGFLVVFQLFSWFQLDHNLLPSLCLIAGLEIPEGDAEEKNPQRRGKRKLPRCLLWIPVVQCQDAILNTSRDDFVVAKRCFL